MKIYQGAIGVVVSGSLIAAAVGCGGGGGNGPVASPNPTAFPSPVPSPRPTAAPTPGPNATATPTPVLTDKSPTLFYFTGPKGEFISQGQTRLFKRPDYRFTPFNGNQRKTLDFEVETTSTDFSQFVRYNVSFDAPSGQELAVGTFDKATRYPFNNGKAGLNISGDGRGCNTLTGKFVIRQIVFNSANQLQNFEADFEQTCDNGPGKLTGTLRYNSTLR